MILLQINLQDTTYHVFSHRGQLEQFLQENYYDIVYYEKDDIYFFEFDDMRMFGRVIEPVNHIEYEKVL